MIVAKTKMKAMPSTCKECKLSYIERWGELRKPILLCRVFMRVCPLKNRRKQNPIYKIPSWCPLIEVEQQKGEQHSEV